MRARVDIPEALYATLRERAARAGVSIDSLIVQTLEQSYLPGRKQREGTRVTGPMVRIKGKLGPRFPVDENPHDLISPDVKARRRVRIQRCLSLPGNGACS